MKASLSYGKDAFYQPQLLKASRLRADTDAKHTTYYYGLRGDMSDAKKWAKATAEEALQHNSCASVRDARRVFRDTLSVSFFIIVIKY